MLIERYDFELHFDYIRQKLGNHIYYDPESLLLDSRLFLRYCKDGNSAHICKLSNGKFRVILCHNKLGSIIFATFSKFEKCIDFLVRNAFSYSSDSLDRIYRNEKLPKIFKLDW